MGIVLMIVGFALAMVGFVCAIIILIAAFQEDAVQGLLCLCIPFYILYYAIARYQSEKKGMIIAGWLGGGILGNILVQAGAAMMAGN